MEYFEKGAGMKKYKKELQNVIKTEKIRYFIQQQCYY